MQKTMPLADFIAQLQKLESQHPGINCVLDDQEDGIDLPDAAIAKIYRSQDNTLQKITPAQYQLALKGIEKYEQKSIEHEWALSPEDFKQNYAKLGGFNQYKKDRENNYQYRKQVVENYHNSQEVVMIKLCGLNT